MKTPTKGWFGAFGVSAVLTVTLGGLCLLKARGGAELDSWIYLGALAGTSLGSLWAAWVLTVPTGDTEPTPAAQDLIQARRAGAIALLFGAPWPLLLANALLIPNRTPQDIGPFDVLTWLGTLATLAVVISGAWVAVYVKRRDDERQHALSLMDMRQAWINDLRSDLAQLLATAREVQLANEAATPDPEAARRVLGLQETIALRLNPVEAHHFMLFEAVRGLLRAAGVNDQLRGATTPSPRTPTTTFDVGVEWVRRLGQLVLKIEWVVTSQGRQAIEAKVAEQWAELRQFELTYWGELLGILPRLVSLRQRHSSLTGGPEVQIASEVSATAEPSGDSRTD